MKPLQALILLLNISPANLEIMKIPAFSYEAKDAIRRLADRYMLHDLLLHSPDAAFYHPVGDLVWEALIGRAIFAERVAFLQVRE